MTVYAAFEIDSKDGKETYKIATPFDGKEAAASKIQSLLEEADPFIRAKDAESGNHHFIHSMKLMSVEVFER